MTSFLLFLLLTAIVYVAFAAHVDPNDPYADPNDLIEPDEDDVIRVPWVEPEPQMRLFDDSGSASDPFKGLIISK